MMASRFDPTVSIQEVLVFNCKSWKATTIVTCK